MTGAACLPVAVSTPRYHILIFSIVYQVVPATCASLSDHSWSQAATVSVADAHVFVRKGGGAP